MSRSKISRQQKKRISRVQSLLGGQAQVIEYGQGTAKFRVSTGLMICSVIFAALFVNAVIRYRIVVFPGVLLIALADMSARPVRGIAVTTKCIFLLKLGFDHKPKRIIGVLPLRLPSLHEDKKIWVLFGHELVRVRKKIYEPLFLAVQGLSTWGQQLAPAPGVESIGIVREPGWFQDPSHRYDFRFWDGANWTQHASQGGVAIDDPAGMTRQ